MTDLDMKLKTSLCEAIENWINEKCESPEFEHQSIYVSPDLSGFMTEAAYAVFDAQASGQRHAVEDGYLNAN